MTMTAQMTHRPSRQHLRAIRLAAEFHPWEEWAHVARVAARCETDEQKTVAWLHDLVEDGYPMEALKESGEFSAPTLVAVEALTRKAGENYADYIRRVKLNPLATAVKLADLDDHTDPDQAGALTESHAKRYTRARMALRG